LILGRSDAAPALYAILAKKGFFDREELWSYRRLGAMLQGTLDPKRTPGVEAPGTGPGLCIGIASGIAAACRMSCPPSRVFCLVGDDELHEGSIWESVQSASALRLGNLTVVAEVYERGPAGGEGPVPLPEKAARRFEAFGWETAVCDGHCPESLSEAFSASGRKQDRPLAVVVKTQWGKGVASLEKKGVHFQEALNREQAENALLELEKAGKRLAEEME
jgi:transketolase